MKVQEQLYPNAIFGNDPKVLEEIHEKENSIAIYQRDIQFLSDELHSVIDEEIAFQESGKVDEIVSALDKFFNENLNQCDALRNDLIHLIHVFDKVTEGTYYRLLFSTVSSNMCQKFHTDINDLRLLCTYSGKGTLWISEDEHNRINDLELPISEEQIHQAEAGDVLILKGALHPSGNPILHRSPVIEETGEKRLILRIDTDSLLDL